jgi:hypothetical protein
MKAIVRIWEPAPGPPLFRSGYTWSAMISDETRLRRRFLAVIRPPGLRQYKSAEGAADAAARTLRRLVPAIPIELELR